MNMATVRKNKKTQAPADAGAELIVMPNSDSEATPSNDNSEEITVKLSTQVILENFLNKHYCFRKNVVTSRIEFKSIKASDFELLNDYKLNSIYRKMKLNRINTSIGELR